MNKIIKTVVIVCLAGLAFLCLAPTSSVNQYYGYFFGSLTGTRDSNLNGYSLTNGNTIQATNIITGGLAVNSTNPGSFFGGAVVATNGFEMPSNAIPALVLTAGKAYFTNMLANFVLASFAGVPADQVWSIYLLATNGSGGNLTVTGPNGAIASGQGKPPVFTVTNGAWAEFQFNGWGQVLTNMNWTPHY